MNGMRDAVALVRELERGDTNAMADILERADEEAVRAQVEFAAVLAELVGGETGHDPKEEMRRAIAELEVTRKDFGDFLEAVLTGEKGTVVPFPATADGRFEQASLLAFIKVGGILTRRYATLIGTDFDQTVAALQLQLAAE